MFKVTDKHVDFILSDIERRGIVTEDVRYNILDHVCCIIEEELKDGKDFKKCYENTIVQFYQHDLSEIEDETQKLLTFKHYYAMKRTLKITGIISIILIVTAIIFKSLHLAGAGIILVLGLVFFSLIFIPLNIILNFQDKKEKQNRLIATIGMLAASAASLGVLFKLMQWPMANILLGASLLVFVFLYIPAYFIVNYRNPESKFVAVINTAYMVAAAGMLFALINFGYSGGKQQEHSSETHQTDITNVTNDPDY